MTYEQWINSSYDRVKDKLERYAKSQGNTFDEDLFHDVLLKMATKTLTATTESSFDDYLFISFKTNTRRERMYARNAKRDLNQSSSIGDLYERYCTKEMDEPLDKVRKDLKTDFAAMYLAERASTVFDETSVHLFSLKFLTKGITYQKLQNLYPQVKGVRQKVLDVKNWLKANVPKEEIDRAFDLKYGEL